MDGLNHKSAGYWFGRASARPQGERQEPRITIRQNSRIGRAVRHARGARGWTPRIL